MSWRDTLLFAVYPELRRYPPHRRDEALQRAREGAFDTVEWIGLVVALGLVALATRYSGHGLAPAELLGVAVADFFLALILLSIVGGPFLRRRTRRHLAQGFASAHEDTEYPPPSGADPAPKR